MLCTRCSINWAMLRSFEEPGDEVYEVCPQCLTDTHLIESDDPETFIQNQITNRLINVRTGKEVIQETHQDEPVKEYISSAYTDFMERQQQYEQKEDAALADYLRTGNIEDYNKHFHEQADQNITDVE